MLSLLGWGCGLRCFPLTRRWLLNYWPRSWSWALIMPQLICSAEHDRTIAIRQTQLQPVRAFPKSLLITNRWYYLFGKAFHLFKLGAALQQEKVNANCFKLGNAFRNLAGCADKPGSQPSITNGVIFEGN